MQHTIEIRIDSSKQIDYHYLILDLAERIFKDGDSVRFKISNVDGEVPHDFLITSGMEFNTMKGILRDVIRNSYHLIDALRNPVLPPLEL